MISFLIKYKRSILIITLLFFMGSIVYLGLDAYQRGAESRVAAKVGSQQIPTRLLDRVTEDRARALRNQGIDVEEDMYNFLRQQILASLISEEVLVQAAKNADLAVADYEVAYDIQTSPFFGGAQGAFNKDAYAATVRRATGMSASEFEEQLRRGKLADRFRGTLYSFYKLTPAETQYAYQTQHGNMKNFEGNKKDFSTQLMDTKMETAQKAFFDAFNQQVEIKTYL